MARVMGARGPRVHAVSSGAECTCTCTRGDERETHTALFRITHIDRGRGGDAARKMAPELSGAGDDRSGRIVERSPRRLSCATPPRRSARRYTFRLVSIRDRRP